MGATTNQQLDISQIRAAAERIRPGVTRSPCPPSIPLSLATGMEIFCKLEYLQRTGSFKERGARNALMLLPPEQQQRGVLAASAGNHALGLAYHGQLLGIPVTVVMPLQAPLVKVRLCEQMDARVIFHGSNVAEAREYARKFEQEEGLTYIHGFDDLAVIAGQGTLGLEIVEQVPDVDAVVVPVGGAGLIAGMAVAIKALKPNVKIIAVQPEQVASLDSAMRSHQAVQVPIRPTLADGLAVPKVGVRAFAIAEPLIDDLVLVSEELIALAVLRLAELEKAVVEGAGAITLAACIGGLLPELADKKVVLPLTGGNIDTTVFGKILERGLAADGRLNQFVAKLPDHPGGLAQFAGLIAAEGGNIIDIEHDRVFGRTEFNEVAVRCVVETRNAEHGERLRARLNAEGFPIQ